MTFTCTHPGCGRAFLPGPGTYIGPADPNDTQCSPFMEFSELCEEHAGPTLALMTEGADDEW
jgi:hypothetical protein